ncbi:YicC/YloC family endoribonuclease [Listeria ivanovii]|uniref:YicC/YloC family endoribonuclease n=1 Tax=Listeria ivanovii TaxID=1638 RepID=UPI000DAA1C35|nr:YicC/YloC family endoribonuclease [Listeria ivanovii]MBC2255214.1 YicC family protein [Listeria ivanovii]MBK2001817.1 YicC family protein [Listeria ivanovii subsp. londoniensis]MBM5608388.1 YicC family protein [Listeria ivanovii]MBM5636431.1 YicC family protein [Listeria ivanovii]MBM5705719.1 YicC family protein [Listeria ivanovii]
MVKSMTGFGRATKEFEAFKVTIELKAVNHRYSECLFRMPKQLAYLEGKLKKIINKQIKRGRMECFFSITGEQLAKRELHIDWDLADSYYRFIKQASARYELAELPKMSDLLQEQAYLSIEEEVDASSELERLVIETLTRATERLDEMRSMEGAELLLYFKQHLATLEKSLAIIQAEIPVLEKYYQEKIENRLQNIVGENVDQSIVLTEVALLLEKADINEEVERTKSHLKQFYGIILLEEPIGRKLDFLIQEMNREINTIGSKANSLRITEQVVEMKTTLEKIREQVQNVE